MTKGKIKRLFFEAIEGRNLEDNVLEVFDRFEEPKEGETLKPRDFVSLQMLKDDFEKGEGEYWDEFTITAKFNELLKIINSKKPVQKFELYEDTYEDYKKKWKEEHNGQEYEDYVREQYQKYIQSMNGGKVNLKPIKKEEDNLIDENQDYDVETTTGEEEDYA